MQNESIKYAGNQINPSRALIMIHGRGGSAEDILSLSDHLNVQHYLIAAPQAIENSWYPNSFLSPVQMNEPRLSASLGLIHTLVSEITSRGISKSNIFFLGFSQGACLTLEYIARNAEKYGGVVAFTGGLIGEHINTTHYKGSLENTPIFIGTSNPDMHVPVERVYATSDILRHMGANITEKIYVKMGHMINEDEISKANSIIFK